MKKLNVLSKVLIFFVAGINFSCKTTKMEEKSKDIAMSEETVEMSKLPFGINQERYKELLDTSLVSTGNNARMKRFLEKIRAGKDVYVAIIGGSVTEGGGPADFHDGYAYQFEKKICELYTRDGGAHVHFDNAGLSGTGSEQGLIRYKSDVLDVLGHKPDLLVVEFAVNDDGKDVGTRCFEAIIRRALEDCDETAVVALYSAAEYGNSMGVKKPVADFYGIPQVNVLALIQRASAAGDIKKNLYYTDTVHPTTTGHTVQCDCLLNLIDTIDKASVDEPCDVPVAWKTVPQKAFSGFTRIIGNDENVCIKAGGFCEVDPKCQALKKTGKSDFPHNWHCNGKNGESFVMDISCKGLLFVYKEQATGAGEKLGKADVFVDGKLVETLNGDNPAGWGNCVPKMIIDDDKVCEHCVEVKVRDGMSFTIIAMGYSK